MRQVKNAAVRYANGPFRAAAGYEQAANAAGTSILKIFNAGGSVGVGAARFYLAYQTGNSVKRDVYEASGSYSFSSADQP
ncbi:porin [Paraburkholderia aspalathi]|uniref:porin n=1 Tax=Paraburkholderia aspalathi TaxID=1324617 RepID=UPI0038BDF9BE